jgi:hypothetical protein
VRSSNIYEYGVEGSDRPPRGSSSTPRASRGAARAGVRQPRRCSEPPCPPACPDAAVTRSDVRICKIHDFVARNASWRCAAVPHTSPAPAARQRSVDPPHPLPGRCLVMPRDFAARAPFVNLPQPDRPPSPQLAACRNGCDPAQAASHTSACAACARVLSFRVVFAFQLSVCVCTPRESMSRSRLSVVF